jgi:hypothetical protein
MSAYASFFASIIRCQYFGLAGPSDATLLYTRMLEVLHSRGYEKPAWYTPIEFAAYLPAETGMLVITSLKPAQ